MFIEIVYIHVTLCDICYEKNIYIDNEYFFFQSVCQKYLKKKYDVCHQIKKFGNPCVWSLDITDSQDTPCGNIIFLYSTHRSAAGVKILPLFRKRYIFDSSRKHK